MKTAQSFPSFPYSRTTIRNKGRGRGGKYYHPPAKADAKMGITIKNRLKKAPSPRLGGSHVYSKRRDRYDPKGVEYMSLTDCAINMRILRIPPAIAVETGCAPSPHDNQTLREMRRGTPRLYNGWTRWPHKPVPVHSDLQSDFVWITNPHNLSFG
jgi:hypothetical protein